MTIQSFKEYTGAQNGAPVDDCGTSNHGGLDEGFLQSMANNPVAILTLLRRQRNRIKTTKDTKTMLLALADMLVISATASATRTKRGHRQQ